MRCPMWTTGNILVAVFEHPDAHDVVAVVEDLGRFFSSSFQKSIRGSSPYSSLLPLVQSFIPVSDVLKVALDGDQRVGGRMLGCL